MTDHLTSSRLARTQRAWRRPVAATRAVLLVMAALGAAVGSAAASERQSTKAIQQAVEDFVRAQTATTPAAGSATEFTVSAPDSRLNLPACPSLVAMLAPGQSLSANGMVTVRCAAPSPWMIYVPVRVRTMSDVVVGARPLAPGQVIGAADLAVQRIDVQQQPAGLYTDPAQLIGKTLASGIAAGQPIRQDFLRAIQAVQQGQTVRLLAQSKGFQVSSEGTALANAAEGRVVQVRLASGQLVSGIARGDATVEVRF